MLALQAPGWVADHPYPAIIGGLVALVIGADLLVRAAVWIALVIGMSRMAVGLTLVALGTSLPELLVTLTAAQSGEDEMAMSNVIGSNASNTLLIVGVAATICAIRLEVRWLELVYSLIATLLLAMPFLLGMDLEPPLAGVMLGMLVIFCAHLLMRERRNAQPSDEKAPTGTPLGWLLHLSLLVGGFCALKFGADWLVGGAEVIAVSFGLSPALIGFTVLAVGTSLPELATSVVAALKKQPEICIGNVIGSNIFNVGAVLGIAGLIQPFQVDIGQLWRGMAVTGASAVLLVLVLRVRKGVPRLVGLVFIAAYFGFLATEVVLSPQT